MRRRFETARSLVANGLGYAILVTKPAHDMSYSGKALASRPIVEELPAVRFVCAWRKDAAPEPSAREFKDLCRRHFASGRARADQVRHRGPIPPAGIMPMDG